MSHESHVFLMLACSRPESSSIQFFATCCLSDLETYLDQIHEDLFNKFPEKLEDLQKVSFI